MDLKRKTLTIWREYTNKKNDIIIPEINETEEYEERERIIWIDEDFKDWDEYVLNREVNRESVQEQKGKIENRKKIHRRARECEKRTERNSHKMEK